jgi:hypothetical protein
MGCVQKDRCDLAIRIEQRKATANRLQFEELNWWPEVCCLAQPIQASVAHCAVLRRCAAIGC